MSIYTSKLKQDGFSASVAHKVTAYLSEVSFCNDGQYLVRIIERCIEEGIGSRKIRQKLAKKGFPKDLIEATLQEKLDEDALSVQLATAMRLVLRFDMNDKKQRDKAFRRLVTRGYSFDIANRVLHERCEQEFHIDSNS
ncbi:MAG: RecX family transcriptional regulator [Coriobacteriia bacterium]|nr:RecX family transcriptional regulator [Coriobacteriia bacterium]